MTLSLEQVTKSYGPAKVLHGIDLEVGAGRIHSLLGANGAGKSTLLKILSGAHRPDEGTFTVDGAPVDLGSPASARQQGIVMVHQEITLVPQMSAVRNVTLGSLRTSLSVIRRREQEATARRHLQEVGFRGDADTAVAKLSVGQQQLVEIAKGLMVDAKVIALDEPTSALSSGEAKHLFEVMRRLAAEGTAFIYVSHRLDEVLQLSDDISVMRGGRIVASYHDEAIRDLGKRRLVEDMMGAPMRQDGAAIPKIAAAAPVLEIEGLRPAGQAHAVTMTVHRGEIVGLFGLVGAGRTELARAAFGLDRAKEGTVRVDGRTIGRRPRSSIEAGVAFLPEDRKSQGLLLTRSIAANVMLPFIRHRAGFFSHKAQVAAAGPAMAGAGINKPGREAVGNLSGGNQQKVLLARWMTKPFECYIFDEPTRGIDVATRAEIYALMESLAQSGAGILVISSETEEILRISSRCAVMHEGELVAEFTDMTALTEQDLLAAASNVLDGALQPLEQSLV